MKLIRHLAVCALSALAVSACGGIFGSEFDDGSDGSGSGGDGDPKSTFGGSGAGGTPGGLGGLEACATSTADGERQPINLVFMMDKSGSMGDNQAKKNAKWNPITSGLKAFFASPNSQGVQASLQYFPLSSGCGTQQYETPDVALRALPDGAFATSMDAQNPDDGTPTLPALKGAIAYAQQVAGQHPSERVAVVLVTDGAPNDCNSTVDAVSSEAAKVAATIPTYVVGVGNVANLDTIAQGGGTGSATIVTVGDPQKTQADFEAAINRVKAQTLSCSLGLPQPPDGKTLDVNAVNVVYTPTGGQGEVLQYSADCSGPGWRYDNIASPSRIELCQSTCDRVMADATGNIQIAFGCATQGGVR